MVHAISFTLACIAVLLAVTVFEDVKKNKKRFAEAGLALFFAGFSLGALVLTEINLLVLGAQ